MSMNLPTFLRGIAKMNPISSLRISVIKMIGLGLLLTLLFFPNSCLAFSNLQDYLTAFKDKHVDVRKGAIEQLLDCLAEEKECLERESPDAFRQLVTAIIDLLADPDPQVQKAAILYLQQSTDARVIKPIARLLRDENGDVRAAAAGAFYHMTVDEGVVEELEHLLKDKNKRVRMAAAGSLVLSGTKKSLDTLRAALAGESDSEVRKLYVLAIRELEARHLKRSMGKGK